MNNIQEILRGKKALEKINKNAMVKSLFKGYIGDSLLNLKTLQLKEDDGKYNILFRSANLYCIDKGIKRYSLETYKLIILNKNNDNAYYLSSINTLEKDYHADIYAVQELSSKRKKELLNNY